MSLKNYFPSRSDILSVYSVIVFWSYTYALIILLYNLPSWMLMTSLGEILGYFSYVLVLVFLDTLPILGGMLGVSFLCPHAWFRDDFAASGSMAAGPLFFWITITQFIFEYLTNLPVVQILFYLLTAVLSLVVIVVAVRRLPTVRKIALWLASSASIFIYVYGLLTIIGVIVILLRNLS